MWHQGAASERRHARNRLTATATRPGRRTCCGSSVVEHSIGNGEVESSILSRSTSFSAFPNLSPPPRLPPILRASIRPGASRGIVGRVGSGFRVPGRCGPDQARRCRLRTGRTGRPALRRACCEPDPPDTRARSRTARGSSLFDIRHRLDIGTQTSTANAGRLRASPGSPSPKPRRHACRGFGACPWRAPRPARAGRHPGRAAPAAPMRVTELPRLTGRP